MTLLVDALVVAGGIIAVRWAMRRARRAQPAPPMSTSGSNGPARPALEGFPCNLGDVVMRRAERDEAWLAGGLVLSEQGPVAVLFIAPEAGRDRAVYVRRDAMMWLSPVPGGPVVVAVGSEPPMSLQQDGMRFERVRRLPVRVDRIGTGAPSVGDQAIVGEYAGPGAERALLLATERAMSLWTGVALSPGDYDVLPGEGAVP